ncbi:MAG: IscS subfamily cysteine desulfurase [Bacteroidota bacterium]|nr:IscS subfamily cysteine desulfurase [Bacteroidota bacterium]
MKKLIYIDNHATTPVDSRVLDAMLPYFSEMFGNPASRQHKFGWVAEEAVGSSRNLIAKFLNADAKEIYFTSSATESNNLALKGVAESYASKGRHIITCSTEHKSVIDTCRRLEKSGYRVTYLSVDEFGLIDLENLKKVISSDTILVSIMTANNEIGTLQDIYEIGNICKQNDILFHTDATQAVGKMKLDFKNMNIDLVSFSGHKIYGPKGIGCLYIRERKPKIKLEPQIDGGRHERGLRSGTLNVPAIVGLAQALKLCYEEMEQEQTRIACLRNKMQDAFFTNLDDVYLNGHPTKRISNNLNMSFMYAEDSAIMMSMKDIAVSSGSACSTAQPQPSHVLKALGLSEDRRHSAIRFGLGRFNTEEEVNYVIGRVINTVNTLRNLSPIYRKKMKINN